MFPNMNAANAFPSASADPKKKKKLKPSMAGLHAAAGPAKPPMSAGKPGAGVGGNF